MFDSLGPQTREAIMKISRTSDTRQRYRIDGLAKGQVRSIAPQISDTVFDTAKFGEVPSRLARARGCLEILGCHLSFPYDPSTRRRCETLMPTLLFGRGAF